MFLAWIWKFKSKITAKTTICRKKVYNVDDRKNIKIEQNILGRVLKITTKGMQENQKIFRHLFYSNNISSLAITSKELMGNTTVKCWFMSTANLPLEYRIDWLKWSQWQIKKIWGATRNRERYIHFVCICLNCRSIWQLSTTS